MRRYIIGLAVVSTLALLVAACSTSVGRRGGGKSKDASGSNPGVTGVDPVVDGDPVEGGADQTTDPGNDGVGGDGIGGDGIDPGGDGTPDGVDPGNDGATEQGSDDGVIEPPIDPVCEPGSVTCEGQELLACKSDGSAWYNLETCGDGATCDLETGACVDDTPVIPPANCPANGTGINIGDQIKDMSWTDTDGQNFNLHSFCGTKKAILIFETAGW